MLDGINELLTERRTVRGPAATRANNPPDLIKWKCLVVYRAGLLSQTDSRRNFFAKERFTAIKYCSDFSRYNQYLQGLKQDHRLKT